MEKIIGKRYYRIEFELKSALAVGSGENNETDKDIVRNSNGIPYIPATALAGIYRSLFSEKEADVYFGKIGMIGSKNYDAADSRIIVYDAVLLNDEYRVSIRDCVGLDEWKCAIDSKKFDFEILEPGVRFLTYIEQNRFEGDEAVADKVAAAWKQGQICIGGKSARGLGCIQNAEIRVMEFSMLNSGALESWLDFDIYDDKAWKDPRNEGYVMTIDERAIPLSDDRIHLLLKLKQTGPITVRVYTTDTKEALQPDYEQLTYLVKKNDKMIEVPVIPGTSWAGSFRHHMERLNGASLEDIFGKKAEKKSEIIFSESEITGAYAKVYTRNAIDRFTGGAADMALFTEKMYVGGETFLEIIVPRGKEQGFYCCLAAAIADLHMGFLTVGGETAVGHGTFCITEIQCNENKIDMQSTSENNGETATAIYSNITKMLGVK